MAKQTITVYINERLNYYINDKPVSLNTLERVLDSQLRGQINASVVLRSDRTVPIQYVVNVIDAVNNINDKYNTKHKVILATRPKR